MKIAFFDTHSFEKQAFDEVVKNTSYEFLFLQPRLSPVTAELAKGCDVVCCFANDKLDREVLAKLSQLGVKLIALRSAGYNHVDLGAAKEMRLLVVRVPNYSPYAVAEHAVALMLTLNRKIHRALQRVHELNFSLEGLVGFDMNGKTVGVIGTGNIGKVMTKIMNGFGCRLLLYDLKPDVDFAKSFSGSVKYVSLEELLKASDVITLHVPLTADTRHMIDADAIEMMKPKVLLINTGRGALIETKALIYALKHHLIGGAGLDVYEEEAAVFFEDHSNEGIDDDLLARLLTFPNVIMTSHQAFLTEEALHNIAQRTVDNIDEFARGVPLTCEVSV
jgi:D-lactate dehydrogenase